MRNVLDHIFRTLLVVFCAAPILNGCSSGAGGLSSPSFATSSGQDNRQYRLRVGDKLKLTVFGETNLSGTYEVNSVNQISLPLIGEVSAGGKTVAVLRETVRKKYARGYLKQPKITIEVTNFRPIFVHGEVKSGGEFAFKNGLKIRDVIAMAGGFTYRADQSYVVIERQGHPAARLRLPSSIEVMPGDNIQVGERFF